LKHGKGIWRKNLTKDLKTDTYYDGEYRNDMKEGTGLFRWGLTDSKSDARNGFGCKDATVYQGEWS